MSTDRELLELAAKAAGIELAYFISNPGGTFFVLAETVYPEVRSGSNESEVIMDDYAATRRAIVICAAEIGKHSAPSKEE